MINCAITQDPNTLYTAGEYIVLSSTDSYNYVKEITKIDENYTDSGVGTILKKEFRYSFDGQTYSEFQDLTLANLRLLGSFTQIFFQYRYTLMTGGPVTFTNVSLSYTTDNEDPSLISTYTPATPSFIKTNFVWDPYKLDKAVQLYKDLNLMVNNVFGHDVHYYRAMPDGRSKDVFLMEYPLYEHAEKVCMKVIVPENAFPDNKLNMGPFGVDFELPFEVQVDKDYYQKIFGEGAGPQKRDVIFFPRTQRIYEISSAYLFRDFMNVPLYFKVTLIKWLPKSNAKQTEEMDTLQSYTADQQSLFGDDIEEETLKVTNPQQYEIAHDVDDPVRNFLDLNQEINDIKLLNYYTMISEYYYNMCSLISNNQVVLDINGDFEKNTLYYVRYAPTTTQPDEQYYYSMKRLYYNGVNADDKPIFTPQTGTSQVQGNFPLYSVFNSSSSFQIYDTDYTGLTSDVSIASCNVSPEVYKKQVVQYKADNDFPSTVDRSYSAWFRIPSLTISENLINSFTLDEYNRQLTITYNKNIDAFIGDLIVIDRRSTSSFLIFGTVIDIVSSKSVVIEIDQYILDFVRVTFPQWQTYTDLKCKKDYPKVFINSMINGLGIKIELYENRHIKVTSNDTYSYHSLPNSSTGLEYDKWYGLFVNFSNIFKQMTVNIWKMQWDSTTNLPATTDLSIVLNDVKTMTNIDRSSCSKFYLEPSNMDLTNIRLFSKICETDKQTLILNQNIVKDAQWAIIIDNALPQSKAPLIGYTR